MNTAHSKKLRFKLNLLVLLVLPDSLLNHDFFSIRTFYNIVLSYSTLGHV